MNNHSGRYNWSGGTVFTLLALMPGQQAEAANPALVQVDLSVANGAAALLRPSSRKRSTQATKPSLLVVA